MNGSTGSRVGYILVGLAVGSAVGILFAPKSGKDTRKYLSRKAEESKEYARRKARELRWRAEDLVDHAKESAARQMENVSGAVDAAREAYQRANSHTKSA
jgi:gas vesicle protein